MSTTLGTSSTSSSSGSMSSTPVAQLGGKKKNGHKAACRCPICVNMMHSKRGGSNMPAPMMKKGGRRRRGSRKSRKGGDIEEGPTPADNWDVEMGPKEDATASPMEETAGPDDYDLAEQGMGGVTAKVGGTRRRRHRRGGRKSRKTHRRRRSSRRH